MVQKTHHPLSILHLLLSSLAIQPQEPLSEHLCQYFARHDEATNFIQEQMKAWGWSSHLTKALLKAQSPWWTSAWFKDCQVTFLSQTSKRLSKRHTRSLIPASMTPRFITTPLAFNETHWRFTLLSAVCSFFFLLLLVFLFSCWYS